MQVWYKGQANSFDQIDHCLYSQAGTHGVHGAPLKADDIKQLKEKFGFNPEETSVFLHIFNEHTTATSTEGAELARRLDGKLPENWTEALPTYTPEDKPLATRKLSEMLFTRVLTGIASSPLCANYKNYGGTFLNFVSYAAGAVRLSALSHLPVTWVATHDSIGLGEDGPTHQPIETLAHLRAIPNLSVWRPADGNEVSAAYKSAIESTSTPHVIALTRQNLPQLEGSSIEAASKGGYTLVKAENPDIIIVASGSEVSLSVNAAKVLGEQGFKVSVVSMPDFLTFDKQPQSYRLSVLPDGVPILSVEVMSSFGWSKYSHEQFGLNRFGASGKADDLFKFFEFTPEGVSERAAKTIQFYKGKPILSPLNRAF
ncbi:Transketolase [Clavispora lusitaniae]|nr:Transketolase [Clavispora lusitaniae]